MRSEMPIQTPEESVIAEVAARMEAVGQALDILVLTQDAALVRVLRESRGGEQRVRHTLTREEAAEQLMSGAIGVMVIDTLVTGADTESFCDKVRRQFPDVVLIVAGTTDDQTQLVKLITAGDIYRFLHKPVSPQRARQFLEAGVRRHLEGRTFTPAETAPGGAGFGAGVYAVAAVILAALIAGGVWYFMSRGAPSPRKAPEVRPAASAPLTPVTQTPPTPAPAAAPPDERTRLLAQADEALKAGQLVEPKGASAADLYTQVLTQYPQDEAANAGIDRVADELLSGAETALLEGRIDDAAGAIESARAVRPNNVRLAFLSAQVAKERERKSISLARQAAANGNFARAQTLLERAAQGGPPSPALLEARREIAQLRLGNNVDGLLKLAGERTQQGKLVQPEGDSARTYIEAALAADPKNATAQQARRALADQTLQKSRQAVTQRDFAAADMWLANAQALNANAAGIRSVQRDLQNARGSAARGAEQARIEGLMNTRLAETKLLEPEKDSAKFYWLQLQAMDPQSTALQPALQTLGAGLTAQAKGALSERKYDRVLAITKEARTLGYSSTDLNALETQANEGVARAAFLNNVVPANSLARDKTVEPRYPPTAVRNGTEGWVQMDFTIATDGSVKDIVVTAAQPVGIFDEAAVKAVAQWRYKPVMSNGRSIEQRARLKLRFDLQ